jgi:hypothetical protein
MLPYLLAMAGGFLIGNTMQTEMFEGGGKVKTLQANLRDYLDDKLTDEQIKEIERMSDTMSKEKFKNKLITHLADHPKITQYDADEINKIINND